MATAEAAQETAPATEQAEAKTIESIVSDALPAWIKNMKISGDLRYRHERADDASVTTERDRDRLRARLLVSTKVNDEVDATIGVASGTNESATNTNQDITGAFSSKNLWLDFAYVDYHPAKVEGLKVFAGKMKNPYDKPGNSDLLFDTDVNPEGIAATFTKALNENVTLSGVVGGHYVQERNAGAGADTSLWVAQGKLTCKLPQNVSIAAGAGYFTYANLQGQAALGTSTTNFLGNTSVGGVYESDFDIFRTFGQASFNIAGQPCSAFGELLINSGAVSDLDRAFLIGASVGKCKDPGSWQFAYNYRDLEADSTVAALVDSTFAGGGTGVKGHKLSVGYQVAKNWTCNFNYMIGERVRAATTDYDVLQLEVNFKF
jgi:hypothetical protein